MSARVLRVDEGAGGEAAIREAAGVLRAGGIVAFPTETVYGLGANALDEGAVRRVFEVKGRPATDPLIVHVLGIDEAEELGTDISQMARDLARRFWPGPLTLVLPRAAVVPDGVTAGLDSVALRAPAHPIARRLLRASGLPIAAPSANPFGRTSPTRAEHVAEDLGEQIDLILDGGPCSLGLESTVVDCRMHPIRLLRPGGIPIEQLEEVCGPLSIPSIDLPAGQAARSPGRLLRHYAPRTPMILVEGDSSPEDLDRVLAPALASLTAEGLRIGLLLADEDEPWMDAADSIDHEQLEARYLGPLSQPHQVAHRLFDTLRSLDDAAVDIILARHFGRADLALAIHDRLRRAAEGRVFHLLAERPPRQQVADLLALCHANSSPSTTSPGENR